MVHNGHYATSIWQERGRPGRYGGGGKVSAPELDLRSNILQSFNDQYGNIDWQDTEKGLNILSEEMPAGAAANKAYQNQKKNSDPQNARREHDKALERIVNNMLPTPWRATATV
jgi:type I restriction enzyme R subunit